MLQIIAIIIGLLIYICPFNAKAYVAPKAPDNGLYVLDLANKLLPGEINNINSLIKEKNTAQYGVLILDNMNGESIEDIAYYTFNAWKIGHKELDNGILIVIAIKERKSRIEVGKGIGGELPDLTANDILKNNLNPYLKSNKFFEGIYFTINSIDLKLSNLKTNDYNFNDVKENDLNDANRTVYIGFLFCLFVLSIFSFIIYNISKINKSIMVKILSVIIYQINMIIFMKKIILIFLLSHLFHGIQQLKIGMFRIQ